MNRFIEMFSYSFMQRAFIVGGLIALAMACIGMVTVLRRQSMIGDALSHTSLAGVALGLVLSFNPIFSAIIVAVISAFAIELFRRFFTQYSEIAIAIVMSTGIGLAGVLSGFVKAANFNAYLFGSIVTIPKLEFWLLIGCSLLIMIMSRVFYRALFLMGFDSESAVLVGVPVSLIHVIVTFMTAISIAIAARTVGTLVVSAQLVLPIAAALQWQTSYQNTYRLALGISLFDTFIGLSLSYLKGFKPGGTIVLISVLVLILCIIAHQIVRTIKLHMRQKGQLHEFKQTTEAQQYGSNS